MAKQHPQVLWAYLRSTRSRTLKRAAKRLKMPPPFIDGKLRYLSAEEVTRLYGEVRRMEKLMKKMEVTERVAS